MAYSPTNWQDTTTPVDASNLNKLEQAVSDNSDMADILSTLLSGRGEQIPNNSDINDYTTAGKYYVGSAANAATMENGPTTSYAYTLLVLQGATPAVIQIAFLNRSTLNTGSNYMILRMANNSGTINENAWVQIV